MTLYWIFFIAAGFFLGGVMFSYHLPLLLKKVNITECSDDHNPGGANAVKLAGWGTGLCSLLCDLLKGFLPVYFSFRYLEPENLLFSLVMFAPVLGHAIAPFYKFSGGKSIAAAFGVLCALVPHSFIVFILAFLYIFFSVVYKINPTSRRSVVTFSMFVLIVFATLFFTRQYAFGLGSLFISVTVVYKHLQAEKQEEMVAAKAK